MCSVQIQFWAETGFGPTQVSARDGFRIQRILGRHEFSHEMSFESRRVSYRFAANRFDAHRPDAYRKCTVSTRTVYKNHI
ncbi:hypothetical protein Hanom_Chr10g00946221 [Helianthus anomalus]